MDCNAEWFLGQTKWKSSKTFWIHLAYQVSRWQGRVGHPTNQHMGDSHGRSENEPPGNGVKLVETTNQTLFVTFVSTLSPAQLLYQHFRLMRWCWTPQNWKIVLLNPHVDLLNACFFRQKPISILLVLESPWFDQGPSELCSWSRLEAWNGSWKLLKSGWPKKIWNIENRFGSLVEKPMFIGVYWPHGRWYIYI